MGLLRLAGLRGGPGHELLGRPASPTPTPHEAMVLRERRRRRRTLHGVRVYVSVYNAGSRTTPLTVEGAGSSPRYAAAIARANPGFRDVIVGNEPNLNRFWLPQFDADGTDAAAPAYLRAARARPTTR